MTNQTAHTKQPSRWTRRLFRRHGERGQSIVEFAMILPVLLVLMMGIVDLGRAFQAWITVTNGAREGARLGITGATTSAIQARVVSTTAGLNPAIAAGNVSVTGAGGNPGNDVTVTVNYNLNLITPLAPLVSLIGGSISSSWTLTSTSVMRIE